jgi:hypothetical protein
MGTRSSATAAQAVQAGHGGLDSQFRIRDCQAQQANGEVVDMLEELTAAARAAVAADGSQTPVRHLGEVLAGQV